MDRTLPAWEGAINLFRARVIRVVETPAEILTRAAGKPGAREAMRGDRLCEGDHQTGLKRPRGPTEPSPRPPVISSRS
jgi:hypothetical protein